MSLWQRYGHLWPQAVVIAMTSVSIVWDIYWLYLVMTPLEGKFNEFYKPTSKEIMAMIFKIAYCAIYLAINVHRLSVALRPTHTRVKHAFYLWLGERTLGMLAFGAVTRYISKNPDYFKDINKAAEKSDAQHLWALLVLFAPFIAGYGLWRLHRNLSNAERLAQQQQQQRQQQQQGLLQQPAADAARNPQAQGPVRERLWPRLGMSVYVGLDFIECCSLLSLDTLKTSYLTTLLAAVSLYINAYGLMAIYRRSIPALRVFQYMNVVALIVSILLHVLYPFSSSTSATAEQDSQILNIDVNSILNPTPHDPTVAGGGLDAGVGLMAEMSSLEFILTGIIGTAFDLWACYHLIKEQQRVEMQTMAAEEAQAHTQAQVHAQVHAQVQAPPQILSHAPTETLSYSKLQTQSTIVHRKAGPSKQEETPGAQMEPASTRSDLHEKQE
ncbi:hypothetical protein BGZ94_003028 [Podila epigama]|nr:hypothetical protein BGZ94_003028 [Podila epigama]